MDNDTRIISSRVNMAGGGDVINLRSIWFANTADLVHKANG